MCQKHFDSGVVCALSLCRFGRSVGAIVGPALGFIGSGLLLDLWVDLGEAPNGLEATDTAWVGAWWLSFIGCGGLSLLFAVMGYRFPRVFPGLEHLHDAEKAVLGASVSSINDARRVVSCKLASCAWLATERTG